MIIRAAALKKHLLPSALLLRAGLLAGLIICIIAPSKNNNPIPALNAPVIIKQIAAG